MQEFIGFDKWLFTLFDTSKTRKISLKKIKEFSQKNTEPDFVILDRNENGFIEPEGKSSSTSAFILCYNIFSEMKPKQNQAW